MNLSKAAVFAMLLLVFGGFNCTVWADDTDINEGAQIDYVKSRTYVGGVGISTTIDQWGDFAGKYAFFSVPATITTLPEENLIPSIQRNFGFGVLVGHREGPWAAELSYWRSDHTATFYFSGPVTFTTPARLEAFSLDFKRYFLTQLPTQPFISIGFSFPWLWVRQGSFLLDPNTGAAVISNDETISGIGFNLGAGLEIYIGGGFSLVGGAYETWTTYDQVNGASKVPLNTLYWDGNPTDISSLAGNGLNLYVGTTVGFE